MTILIVFYVFNITIFSLSNAADLFDAADTLLEIDWWNILFIFTLSKKKA